jgi:hypothetical protein
MCSRPTPDPNRREAVVVLLFMVVATLWYAWPQLLYSLYPLVEIWRSLPR